MSAADRDPAPDPITARIRGEIDQKRREQRDAWDRLFAEWLTNRA